MGGQGGEAPEAESFSFIFIQKRSRSLVFKLKKTPTFGPWWRPPRPPIPPVISDYRIKMIAASRGFLVITTAFSLSYVSQSHPVVHKFSLLVPTFSISHTFSSLSSSWQCLGGVTVRASDLRSSGRGFDSRSGRYQAI